MAITTLFPTYMRYTHILLSQYRQSDLHSDGLSVVIPLQQQNANFSNLHQDNVNPFLSRTEMQEKSQMFPLIFKNHAGTIEQLSAILYSSDEFQV